MPVSIMEAMSAGVPAIAPCVGGIRYLVDENCGRLLSENPTPEEYCSSISELYLEVDRKAMREAARKKIEKDFSSAKNYRSFIKEIELLVEKTLMVFRKIAVFAVGSVGSAVLGLVTLPIITWFYSAEDVGRIAMLQVASNFCVLLFCLGLDQAYVREYHEEKNRSGIIESLSFSWAALLAFILLFVFFYDASILAELMYEKNDVLLAYLTILCFIFALVSRFLSLILRMQERALAFSLTQILPKILFLLVIASFITFSVPASFGSLLIAQAISMFAIMSFFAWNTRGEWRPWNDYVLHKARFYEIIAFRPAISYWGGGSMGTVCHGQTLLRAFSSFAELGLYSVAASIAAGAGILGTIFTTIWSPTVFKWAAEGVDEKKIDEVSEHVLACVFYIFVISGLFSWMVPIFFA
ncbi:lipopolysaccharide biosynthesis protein [Pseudomonas aeruginosa]|uniref:lipopolysaccharide biosynthesis protein n=1 Tax=Pseudomonas aeruginosa TaxID=287 RepID=UPI001FC94AF0|nr:lipopolysaccharide biosynthesis protein [Pseudomonas aeruginosa]